MERAGNNKQIWYWYIQALFHHLMKKKKKWHFLQDLHVCFKCNKVFYRNESREAAEELSKGGFEPQKKWERQVGLEETLP